MKASYLTLLCASVAFFASTAAFALDITGTLKSKDTEDTVAISASYEYQGTSSLCMSNELTEDGFKKYPFSSRRVFVLGSSKLDRKIPTQVVVSGKMGLKSCVLARTSVGRLGIIKKQVLKNITKPQYEGKKIDETTYEIKRGFNGLTVLAGANSNNRLSCSFRQGDLTAQCNSDSVSFDAQGAMKLDIINQ